MNIQIDINRDTDMHIYEDTLYSYFITMMN